MNLIGRDGRTHAQPTLINRYGLSVSPCMVPLCMCTGLVLPKCGPKNIVDELEYMFPIRLMAS
jgi:hypothetical protein